MLFYLGGKRPFANQFMLKFKSPRNLVWGVIIDRAQTGKGLNLDKMKRLRNLDFSKIGAIFLYGALLLLAILIISLDLPLKNSDPWQIHYNEEFGFSLQFPDDWMGEVTPTYRYPNYMRASLCSTCDTNSSYIYIYAVPNDGSFANPTKWMSELLQSTNGFNLRIKSVTTVGTKDYEASVWNFSKNVRFNVRTKSEAVLFVVDETVYMIQFSTTERRFDDELSQFHEILSTFEVAD